MGKEDSKVVTYASSGVDIDTAEKAMEMMKGHIEATYNHNVLSELGTFGGVLNLFGNRVLIISTDGVGTKTSVAVKAHRYNTVGQDLVNHCVNDILVRGNVKPMAFTDYVASAALDPKQLEQIISGVSTALCDIDAPLIAGETAEMPGMYVRGQFDLVGTMIGLMYKEDVLDGPSIIDSGDIIIGLLSSGLHTNGYSLARRVIFKEKKLAISSILYTDEVGKVSVADELLKIHRPYYNCVQPLMRAHVIKGAAHITGGGIPGNLIRILGPGITAILERKQWQDYIPPVFDIIREAANQPWDDYFKTFNDGIGMCLVVDKADADGVIATINTTQTNRLAIKIGEIVDKPGGGAPQIRIVSTKPDINYLKTK